MAAALYPPIVWGLTSCNLQCGRRAELSNEGQPLCSECADGWVDRVFALELAPTLERLLPPPGPYRD